MTKEQDSDANAGDHNHDESNEQGRHEAPTLSARRRPRWWIGAIGALVIALTAAFFFIPTSYTTYGPGNLWQTEHKIDVEGQNAFDSDGEITYATVSVKRASTFELVRAYFDDTIDVKDFEQSYPTGDPQQERVINLKKMDDAKLTALLVAFRELGLPASLTGSGAFVEEVVEGMPADGKLEQGEVIVKVDEQTIETNNDLTTALDGRGPGDEVALEVRGLDGEVRPVTLVLAPAPTEDGGTQGDQGERGFLGVSVTTADQDLSIPFDIELDSGDVTGPSAGLAWTLGVIDKLSPEDLTEGKLIAATGTIGADGSVGTIGGIVQKVKAAIGERADVFLYPEGTDEEEVDRITEMADGELELLPVGTVEEAIDFLLDGAELETVPLS